MDERHRILLLVFVYSAIHIDASQEFNISNLHFVVLVQKEFCGAETLCNSEYAESLKESTRFLDDLPISPMDYIHPGCCRNCSCDLETCRDFGSCCPDILDRLPSLEEALRPKRVVCSTPSLKALGDIYTYWIYSRCPDDFDAHMMNKAALETKSKCEKPHDYFDLDTRQPVIDSNTQRTYSNRFCALCDFVEESNLVRFKIGLRCYNGARFSKSVNIETLVKDVLSTESCDLEFYWPDDLVNFQPPHCRSIEVGCNITGKWLQYDPLVETACHTYRARYNYKYNNIFCFMCNENEYANQCFDEAGRIIAAVSFAAVLDFNRVQKKESITATQCTENQVLDKYKGVCRDVLCTFPGVLQGGQCVNPVGSMTEVAYIFQLQFTPLSQQENSELPDVVTVIEEYVQSLLESWNVFNATADSYFYHLSSLVFIEHDIITDLILDFNEASTLTPTPNITEAMTSSSIPTTTPTLKRRKREVDNETNIEMEITIPPFMEEIPVIPPPNDEFSPRLKSAVPHIDYVLWQVRWYFKFTVAQHHSPDFIENVLDLDKRNVTLDFSVKNKSFSFSLAVVDYELDDYNFPIDPVRNTILMAYPSFIFLPFSYMLKPIYAEIQKLKPSLICPLIKIRDSEYNITNHSDGIFVEELNNTFYKPYIEMVDPESNKSEFLICAELFIGVTDKYALSQTTKIPEDESVTVEGVLSVIFSCISILCSLMTLITYSLFKEFRTQPGVNNMFLCVYLICAQSLFTFATPQNDNVSELMCSVLGALTHFFWLMVIFAMNVCCFHMVTVFRGQPENRTNRGSNCYKSLMYNSYCIISSLFFIVVNITISLLDQGENNIGYGEGLCYISQPWMVGYVFAIPLGVILFANIASFLFVAIKISSASNVSISSKKTRNLFKIYTKLSSLTGLTWIFGFLYVFTKIKTIEYLFIIFNGGIGFFIFISFVCNRRTFEKYKSLVYKVDSIETQSTTKNTTLTGDVKT